MLHNGAPNEPTVFRADLHCHTTCSDGSFSVENILLHAKELGLKGLSITDHDTVDAYEVAIPLAQKIGILLGVGVEFSADYKGNSIHVLGYDFDYTDLGIRKFCEAHQKRRESRNREILKKLRVRNFVVEEEELATLPGTTKGRPHIAYLMIQKGYVRSVKEAFQLYLGERASCYVPGDVFTVQETIDVIHKAGGKAFIAHPHIVDDGKTVLALLKMDFDGIECYYARCIPKQEKRWLKIAKERGWLMSGGSDFHGEMRPYIPLGCSWVDEETFGKIFSRKPTL